MGTKISEKIRFKKFTENFVFGAHLRAETFMKKEVENSSKNPDSSMSNFSKNGLF